MNIWLIFSIIFLICFIPGIIGCLRGKLMERFVSLQIVQTLTVITMLLLSEGFGRDIYFDAALALAVLSFAASLVFVRFLERWL